MWHTVFAEQIPFAEKVLRTVLVYVLIAVLIRAVGKRGLAAFNTLDIVVMILLSNIVQNAIIGNDLSFTGGAIGAVTLVVVNTLLNRLAVRSAWFERIFDGTATTVIKDGHASKKQMRRLGLRRAELDHAVRLQNGADVKQVEKGELEPGGQLVLSLRADQQGATKADVDALQAQLARIEAALAASGR